MFFISQGARGKTKNWAADDLASVCKKWRKKTGSPAGGKRKTIQEHHILFCWGRSVQTGVAALLAFNMDSSLDEIAEAMTEVAGEVGEGRVCKASRDVTIYGHEIKAGMTFATFDDEIVTVGRDPLHVLIKLIEDRSKDAEIITVYTGEPVSPEQVAATTESLEKKFKGLEIEVVYGGQPHYDYLIAVE